ncbi:MAG: hypothetical protein FWH20_06440 [Oscillospiraceae bacterium]|nr:hypothetical protein [Oscillospiraceae bacterium]
MAGPTSSKTMQFHDGFIERWRDGGFDNLSMEDKEAAIAGFNNVFDYNSNFSAGIINLEHSFQNIFINGQLATERYAAGTQGMGRQKANVYRMCAFYADVIDRQDKVFAINNAPMDQDSLGKFNFGIADMEANVPTPPYKNPITPANVSPLKIDMTPDPEAPQPRRSILGMEWLFDLFAAFGWVTKEPSQQEKCVEVNTKTSSQPVNVQEIVNSANLTRDNTIESYEKLRSENNKLSARQKDFLNSTLPEGHQLKTAKVEDGITGEQPSRPLDKIAPIPRVDGRARWPDETESHFRGRVSKQIEDSEYKKNGKDIDKAEAVANNWLEDGTDPRRKPGESENDYNLRMFLEKAAYKMDADPKLTERKALNAVAQEYNAEYDKRDKLFVQTQELTDEIKEQFAERVSTLAKVIGYENAEALALNEKQDKDIMSGALKTNAEFKAMQAEKGRAELDKLVDEKQQRDQGEAMQNLFKEPEPEPQPQVDPQEQKKAALLAVMAAYENRDTTKTTEPINYESMPIESEDAHELRVFMAEVAIQQDINGLSRADAEKAVREEYIEGHNMVRYVQQGESSPESLKQEKERYEELKDIIGTENAKMLSEHEKRQRDIESGVLVLESEVKKAAKAPGKATVSMDELPGGTVSKAESAGKQTESTKTKVGTDISDEITGKANEKISQVHEKPADGTEKKKSDVVKSNN